MEPHPGCLCILTFPTSRAALDGSLLHPAWWAWDSPAPVSFPAAASPGGWPASCPPLMASPVPKAVWGTAGTFPRVTAPLSGLPFQGRVLQCCAGAEVLAEMSPEVRVGVGGRVAEGAGWAYCSATCWQYLGAPPTRFHIQALAGK